MNGTKSSFAAVDWAAERASRGATRVEIVMIGGSIMSPTNRLDASIIEAERRLLERAPDVQIAWRHFPGRMPESLFEHAQAADLIVVGCHPRQAGSHAPTARLPSRIVCGSTVPVVVVPDAWSPASRPILVGLDADDSSRAALDVAAREAVSGDTELRIVHACPIPPRRGDEPFALCTPPLHDRTEHGDLLRTAVTEVRGRYPGLHIEGVFIDGDPAEALLALSEDASLIVLGTHHRGLFVGAILGSVGHDVLPQARVPLCIVPNSRMSMRLPALVPSPPGDTLIG